MDDLKADICDLIIHHKERVIERVLRLHSGKVVSAEIVGGPYVVGDWNVIRAEFLKHHAEESYRLGRLFRVEEVIGL